MLNRNTSVYEVFIALLYRQQAYRKVSKHCHIKHQPFCTGLGDKQPTFYSNK